ncbi:glutamine-hydrolyzing GMP synthase [bacterium]|nr:glutamine-hydrolyzing GMP synthase [bacterium]MCI0601511.1 glutamine-hydrolyzing GMP synthase [bacterium]
MKHDAIAVLDFGGQYAHLIATKIRRLKVYAEILQPEDPVERLAQFKGIILSGSPSLSAYDEDSLYDKRMYDLPIPILGFCFGHQEIAKHYGGRVEHTQREYGPAVLRIQGGSPIFTGMDREETVWMSHGDTVTLCPAGFDEIGVSITGGISHANAAIASDSLRRYGFQFHPEVDDTIHGEEMLRNFCINICGCRADWTMENYLQEVIERIPSQAAGRPVFLLASGGIDSTVCALLLGRALGPENVHLLHIDNGLMRKNESEMVLEALMRHGLGANLYFSDASELFLKTLAGVTDPEKKRRIIGDTFVDVFHKQTEHLNLNGSILAQGTIYPDTIETGGTKRADVIKTHHNRVPVIQQMIQQGCVIEPLSELYKTEVRELGETLGLPEEIVWRHPFPGPGLGIRLLCSDDSFVDAESLFESQQALKNILAETATYGIVLPVRSVGVKADLRSYEHPVMLWGNVVAENAESLAAKIFQKVPGVNRCVVDLTGYGVTKARPLAATITRERLDLLREADAIVMDALRHHGLYRKIWQCPTVFVPLEINQSGREFVVIRPVLSERAMTARPALLPSEVLKELRDRILQLPGISGVAVDISTKPPGTIEWE